MMKIETSIEINATAEKVWDLLMDFSAYPQWNPFIVKIMGNPQVGEQIEINLQNMKFKPMVLVNNKNKAFRWKGKLGMKGIFDGEHYFKIENITEGKVKFIHGEEFKGILVPFLKGKLNRETKPGFIAMNESLKQQAEKK